jgi:hypothetical protein
MLLSVSLDKLDGRSPASSASAQDPARENSRLSDLAASKRAPAPLGALGASINSLMVIPSMRDVEYATEVQHAAWEIYLQ